MYIEFTKLHDALAKEGRNYYNNYYLFNDALKKFYLWLYGVGHMTNGYSDSERGNRLPPHHGLLCPISSKGYFVCNIPQSG